MLTKAIGTSTGLTLTTSPQTVVLTTFETGDRYGDGGGGYLNVLKVRIACSGGPCYVGLGTTATTTGGILLPANVVEHYKLTNTSTVSILGTSGGGVCSVTPVA